MKKGLVIKLVVLTIITVSIFTIFSSLFESNAAAITGVTSPSTLSGKSVSGTDKIKDLGNQAITILSVIGTVVSVIVLIVLGLKYMMGSTEEKAEYKKTLMPYVIGAIIIFAASVIAGVVYSFAIGIQ